MRPARRWWQGRRGVRALREIAIVVAGILIAFGLDAWWEQRAAATRERAHLRALTADFQQNVERLEELVELEHRISRSSRELLLIAQRGGDAPPDSLRRLFSMVFTSSRFEPVMGAYQELESSGGLALLRDDSLRSALASFSAGLEVRYYEHFSTELYIAMIRDLTGQLSFFAPSVAETYDAASFGSAARALLGERKFREQLALRHLTERDVAREYQILAEQARAVLARLRRLTG